MKSHWMRKCVGARKRWWPQRSSALDSSETETTRLTLKPSSPLSISSDQCRERFYARFSSRTIPEHFHETLRPLAPTRMYLERPRKEPFGWTRAQSTLNSHGRRSLRQSRPFETEICHKRKSRAFQIFRGSKRGRSPKPGSRSLRATASIWFAALTSYLKSGWN